MRDKLAWSEVGVGFEDGSRLSEWRLVDSGAWQWQYDTHELRFDIYAHGGAFWKLYRIRSAAPGSDAYQEGFGGVACRVAYVEYRRRSGSPHSRLLMQAGDREWVRVGEIEPELHEVVKEFSRAA